MQKSNFASLENLINNLLSEGFTFDRQKTPLGKGRYIIQSIPKIKIVEFIKKLKISKYSSDFDTRQIAAFLQNTLDQSIDKFDLAFMEGSSTTDERLIADIAGRRIPKVLRRHCDLDKALDRLCIGKRGKLGGTDDGRAGIVDFNGMTATEIFEQAKARYRVAYKDKYGIDFTEGKTYPSETWFKYIENRRPIIFVYMIDVGIDEEQKNQEKQINEFKEQMNGIPALGFAMGLPRNDQAAQLTGTKYKVNKVYNWFDQADILAEGDED